MWTHAESDRKSKLLPQCDSHCRSTCNTARSNSHGNIVQYTLGRIVPETEPDAAVLLI